MMISVATLSIITLIMDISSHPCLLFMQYSVFAGQHKTHVSHSAVTLGLSYQFTVARLPKSAYEVGDDKVGDTQVPSTDCYSI